MTEPKKGWFQRLSEGLSRTSRQMGEQVGVLTRRPLDQAQLDELEEMLIEADLGPKAAAKIAAAFGDQRFGRQSDEREIKEALAGLVAAELIPRQGEFDPLSGPRPFVVLFVGVNGSGKTTTLGKIAADIKGRGAKVLVVAGDTFRAAAVEQLHVESRMPWFGDLEGLKAVPISETPLKGDVVSRQHPDHDTELWPSGR